MQKKAEMKQDGQDFTRFENFMRKIVSVPKEEINRREKQEKEAKEVNKYELDTRRR
jgi:hypothetical protein